MLSYFQKPSSREKRTIYKYRTEEKIERNPTFRFSSTGKTIDKNQGNSLQLATHDN